MKSGPSEDPEEKKARLLERQRATLERRRAAQESAGSLTTDYQNVYGLQSLFNFGQAGAAPKPKAPSPKPTYITGSWADKIGK